MKFTNVQWTYGIIRASGAMETKFSIGPLAPEEIERILGGTYELMPLMDSTVLAVRKDRDEALLPPNPHYQNQVRGDIVLGKIHAETGEFVGVLGIEVGGEKKQ